VNRLNMLLASTTLVFGTTTIYHARALLQQRTANQLPAEAPLASNTTPQASAEPARTGVPPALIDTAADVAEEVDDEYLEQELVEVSTGGPDLRDPGTRALFRSSLAELRDPQQRAALLRENIARDRWSWQPIAALIGLTPAELERFLQAQAERNLRELQRRQECGLNPACYLPALQNAYSEPGAELAAVLGAEQHARFRAYAESIDDRERMGRMQRRLPVEARLPEPLAEKLVLALANERRRFTAEAERDGLQVFQTPETRYLPLLATAESGAENSFAQRKASAAQYAQRLRDLAASVLGGTQLAEFNALLSREQAEYEHALRSMEADEAVWKAARQ
jgi:hypothetical protein